jgi:uracil-DNA glycosylase
MSDVDAQIHPRDVSSLLRWWQEAGVDTLIDEAPMPWMQRGAATKPKPDAIAPADAPALADTLPNTVAKLVAWLGDTQNFPVTGLSQRRVSPFGTPGARLMIMTDLPEQDDLTDGLLSGATGALFDKMLTAIGRDRSQIYCAPLCPARPASGRLDDAGLNYFGEIARHHIRLAAPKRVWLLGQSTSRAVLGTDYAPLPPRLHNINQDGVNVEIVASFHPRLLLQHPKRKAKVWADMQILVEGMNA